MQFHIVFTEIFKLHLEAHSVVKFSPIESMRSREVGWPKSVIKCDENMKITKSQSHKVTSDIVRNRDKMSDQR